jgi:hypothetical protein
MFSDCGVISSLFTSLDVLGMSLGMSFMFLAVLPLPLESVFELGFIKSLSTSIFEDEAVALYFGSSIIFSCKV